MDYARIYGAFVADRRARRRPEGYTERHHVRPVSLGGGNESSNLIDLSPRDHYFAHCCLAKMHGGKMWSALFAIAKMSRADHSARYFLQSRMVAIARTRAAAEQSKRMSAAWATGEFSREREYEPHSAATKARISASTSGRKKSAESIAKRQQTRASSAEPLTFRKAETGDSFTGRVSEFCALTGISQSLASCLTRGRILSAKGWHMDGSCARSLRGKDGTERRFEHSDGRVFRGTAYEFRTQYALDSGVISNLIHGKNRVKSFKGWRYTKA